MKTFLILLTEDVMDSSLTITLDILRTANLLLEQQKSAERLQILLAGFRRKVSTGAGLQVRCDLTFKQVLASGMAIDWILLPGSGKKNLPEIEDHLTSRELHSLMEVLRHYANLNTGICASCASTFTLAESGLLTGKSATTSWWLASAFRHRYPHVILDEANMLVRDKNILTAGAAFSQMDVVLELVAATAGVAIAYLCSRYLLIEQRSSQARFMIPTQNQHLNPIVIAAEKWIDANLSRPLTVQEMAAQLALSTKTLSRKIVEATGDSPIRFIQRRKLMRAVYLLESTSLPIERVAERVGYQNSTMLRHLMKRELGLLPGQVRK